jgi:hypothetical protein
VTDSNHADNHANRHAHSPDAGFPTHNLWVHCYSVKVRHATLLSPRRISSVTLKVM